MSVMHNSDQITVQWPYLRDYKSLTLRWRSFPERGGDRVAISFAYTSCQYVSYEEQRPDHCSMTGLTRPHIVEALLTLILRMGQWLCCCHLHLQKLPIHWLCITATRSLLNDRTYKSTNCWRCFDTHSQNCAVSVLLFLLPIQAANRSVVHNSDHITVQWPYLHDHKSLMLRWCSLSEWGSYRVAVAFAYTICQYVVYA